MNTRKIQQRLATLEEKAQPASGGYFIMELAEKVWREDRTAYIEMALERCPEMRYWLPWFTEEKVDWLALQRESESHGIAQYASAPHGSR